MQCGDLSPSSKSFKDPPLRISPTTNGSTLLNLVPGIAGARSGLKFLPAARRETNLRSSYSSTRWETTVAAMDATVEKYEYQAEVRYF